MINQSLNTFKSAFINQLAIDADVKPLPGMNGSGLVSELRQAASMDTTAGLALKAKLAAFAATTTSTDQIGHRCC